MSDNSDAESDYKASKTKTFLFFFLIGLFVVVAVVLVQSLNGSGDDMMIPEAIPPTSQE